MRYEIRFFDKEGQLSHTRELDCDGDDRAIGRLAEQPHRYAMELWGRGVLIFRFDASSLWR